MTISLSPGKTLGIALSAQMLVSVPALAYDLPPVNLGFTSFLDGAPPSGPGWYVQEYLQYYDSGTLKDGHGNSIYAPTPSGLKKHEASAFISLTQLIYQSNTPLLAGGKWGMNLMLPFVDPKVSPGNSLAIEANSSGFGDLLVGPYLQWDPIMGANGPIFMHRIEAQMIFPTGKYDADRELNPGSNFFSFNPYWAGTLFFTPQWTASWRLHWLWNDKNEEPNPAFGADDMQAGQAVHINFASEYELLPKQFRLGINGYYLKQTTDTEVDGRSVSGRKEQVLGLGPGMVWHLSPDTHIFANLYFESEAENRPEGTRMNLRLVHHF